MAGMVSVRVKGLRSPQSHGAFGHDSRTGYIPKNVDRSRTHLNTVLIGDMTLESLSRSREEQEVRIRNYTKKAPRKDANYYISGIITFSKEARDDVNSRPPDEQAKKFVEDLARSLNLKILYLIRHSDESTNHFHFMLENVDTEGRAKARTLNKKALSEIQDKAGEFFNQIGIKRGIKKKERLENGEPYSKTVHRSVQQLHVDLPKEISALEEKRDDLKHQTQKIQEKIDEFTAPIPEPRSIPVEIVKERHLLRTETVKAKVININDFAQYKKSVAGRVAVADTILSGDVVPGQEFREVSQELTATKADLAQTRMDLSSTRREMEVTKGALQKAKKEIGVLSRIIDWIAEQFPDVLKRFVADQEKEVMATPSSESSEETIPIQN